MAQENIQEPVLHECTCQTERGQSYLPKDGERVRVCLTKKMEIWQGNKRIALPEGTMFEGTTQNSEPEGFFDVVDDAGKEIKFYIHDSSIQVERAPAA